MHHIPFTNEPMPTHVKLVRARYKDEDVVIAYTEDRREYFKMMQAITQRDKLLEALNKSASILLSARDEKDINSAIKTSMASLCKELNLQRAHMWNTCIIDGKTMFEHTFEWACDKLEDAIPVPKISPFGRNTGWVDKFKQRIHVNISTFTDSDEERETLIEYGIKSLLSIPIYIGERLWGLITYDDCFVERDFTEEEVSIMGSLGFMIASTLDRHAYEKAIQDDKRT